MLSILQLDQILQLAQAAFGKSYLNRETLLSFDASHNSKIILAEENEVVIGFSIVLTFKKEEFSKHLFIDAEQLPEEECLGYRKMTVIKPENRGRGIGAELIRKGEAFIQKNSNTVYSSIWCNGSEGKMMDLLEKNGYHCIDKSANYWSEDSLKKQYDCVICGKPPCKCAALIYKKNLILEVQ